MDLIESELNCSVSDCRERSYEQEFTLENIVNRCSGWSCGIKHLSPERQAETGAGLIF
jgi:hypothetical protein